MEKKITCQGPKGRESYTVTLPKEWIKKTSIDKTKIVNLEIAGNKIIISKEKEIEQKIVINSESYKDSIEKALQILYKLGLKELKIMTNNEKLTERILEVVNNKLIGYEILEHKKDYVLISDITKESEEDFKTILRRIFLLMLEFSEYPDKSRVKIVKMNINKLYNYCQRILIKKGHSDFEKVPFYYLLLDQLEKISDELAWIFHLELKKNEKQILNELFKLLEDTYKLFYKFDPKSFNRLSNESYKLKEKIKLEEKINVAIMHLHNMARLLNSINGTIFAIKFENDKTNL